jgi:hypothetical protein
VSSTLNSVRLEVLAVDKLAAVRDRQGMTEPLLPAVTGLLPRAVRVDLVECQVQLLVNELLSRIETMTGSLREDHDRHGSLSHDAVADAAAWLFEYRTLLEALNADRGLRRPATLVSVTTSAVVADSLIRACADRAADDLAAQLRTRSIDSARLRDTGAAVFAWTHTLLQLCRLDEDAPDWVLDD